MFFAGLVVAQRFVLDGFFGQAQVEPVELLLNGQTGRHLKAAERNPGVALGVLDQEVETRLLGAQAEPAQSALGVVQGAGQDGFQLIRAERLKHQHPGSGQERRDDLKRRIFGGGAQQDDQALLDVGQKCVLLGLVEAVDFIHKQDGRGAVLELLVASLVKDLTQLLDPRQHGRKGRERHVDRPGQEPGQARLAAARRTPQNQRRQTAAFDHAPQQTLRPQQVRLTHVLVNRPGAHPLGQRGFFGHRLCGTMGE